MSRATAFIAAGVVILSGIAFLGLNEFIPSSGRSPVGHEMLFLSAAIEEYRAERGAYPRDAETSDQLRTNSTFDPQAYIASSAFLYHALSRPTLAPESASTGKRPLYKIPTAMLAFDSKYKTYIADPWGNSIGYSTIISAFPNSQEGNNPTFDLWSTGGGHTASDKSKWIRNW